MPDQPKQQYFSPLRYPGGKASLYGFLKNVLEANKLKDGIYVEPFAGGAGAALALLVNKKVSRIILNDKDPFIYKFWWSVLNKHEELIELIKSTPVTIDEYKRRKIFFRSQELVENASDVEVGFTAFFLNRCNRSGILHAGPIGGIKQGGEWKLHVRYNKEELVRRINTIHALKSRIKVYNMDAKDFLQRVRNNKAIDKDKLFVYLDPPYVEQGFQLYKHFFKEKDHIRLAKYVRRQQAFRWMVSYDDHPLISSLYATANQNHLWLNYFANIQKMGKELIIANDLCRFPAVYKQYSRQKKLNQLDIQFLAAAS